MDSILYRKEAIGGGRESRSGAEGTKEQPSRGRLARFDACLGTMISPKTTSTQGLESSSTILKAKMFTLAFPRTTLVARSPLKTSLQFYWGTKPRLLEGVGR